ncbi:MAG: isopenicillin N synthase family oxygenase [Saprospiraceae bacterium]|nr:isopenicillin N synthase family oxygenase [Saprospiraceae bacterium]
MIQVPVIDVSELFADCSEKYLVAEKIKSACIEFGFFYLSGHGISEDLQRSLEECSKTFFLLPLEEKMKIWMSLGGHAWRGYFPVGDELTSGKPDLKEGIYFGQELDSNDERVKKGLLLHGKNLFPDGIPDFAEIVLAYMSQVERLGHALMRGISLSLGLDEFYIHEHYTSYPLILFRIFHYPPAQFNHKIDAPWGVGEHTDYGLLTILKQDEVGGLQIKVDSEWINAPYIHNTFVCNIGDMLEILTKGLFRSTPHRVLNKSGSGRYSFPLFFDPAFDVNIQPLPFSDEFFRDTNTNPRWDNANLHVYTGTYGDYITRKVGKVFPELKV